MKTLIQKVADDLLAARLARHGDTSAFLALFLSDANAIGKNDGNRSPTDVEVTTLAKKYIANSQVMLEHSPVQANDEIQLLQKYVPTQMTEEELYCKIEDVVVLHGVEPSLGAIMAYMKANHAGTYDGKIASRVVREFISNLPC